MNNTAEAPHYP